MKENVSNEEQPAKKLSLLRRFDIPIEYLDFKHIKECENAKELEKILVILRSGEEGHYPELMKCAEDVLVNLNPKSRLLRVEKPVLRPEDLEKIERKAIQEDLLAWVSNINEKKESEGNGDIFTNHKVSTTETDYIPIRGEETSSINTQSHQSTGSSEQFLKPTNTKRIKSWEYDKWDKFDIDAELTRLDIQDMQIKEWESTGKSKVQKEQKQVELLMKNKDINERESQKSENKKSLSVITEESPKPKIASFAMPKVEKRPSYGTPGCVSSSSALPKSFIEELPADYDSKSKIRSSGKNRVKVIIDDVNIGF